MEVSKPVLNKKDQSYLFQVNCTDPAACSIRTVGAPVAKDISGILNLFLTATRDHFESGLEFEDVQHIWDTHREGGVVDIGDTTEIWWAPKRILITPFLVSIEWMIVSVGAAPGGAPAQNATPGKAGLQRRRVREARLRAAAAHLRAERLAEAYYRKYGPELLSDADSSLSET